MQNIIYGLVDPRTLLVRYIGLSTSGLYRPRSHTKTRELSKPSHKNNWIKSLIAAGLRYTVVVFDETVSRDALPDLERWWITYGRALGWSLTNLTEGGDGLSGAAPEVRAKISAAAKRRFASPEARAKLSTALKQAWPPESRAIIAASNKRRGQTPESRAKIAATMRRIRAERFWS